MVLILLRGKIRFVCVFLHLSLGTGGCQCLFQGLGLFFKVTHRPQPQEPVLTRFTSAAGGSRRQVLGPEGGGGRRLEHLAGGAAGPAAPGGLMPGRARTWPPRAPAYRRRLPANGRWGRAHPEVTWGSWLPRGGRGLCSWRWSDGGGQAELPTRGQVGQVRWTG